MAACARDMFEEQENEVREPSKLNAPILGDPGDALHARQGLDLYLEGRSGFPSISDTQTCHRGPISVQLVNNRNNRAKATWLAVWMLVFVAEQDRNVNRPEDNKRSSILVLTNQCCFSSSKKL